MFDTCVKMKMLYRCLIDTENRLVCQMCQMCQCFLSWKKKVKKVSKQEKRHLISSIFFDFRDY